MAKKPTFTMSGALILTRSWCSIKTHIRRKSKHLTRQLDHNREDVVEKKASAFVNYFSPEWKT